MPEMRGRWRTLASASAIAALLAVAVIGLVTGSRPEPDRALQLQRQLRCPVCTTVSIAESGSETAAAMRRTVTEQVAAGRSDQQIIGYFRARYGDWVLLDPPARGATLWLWLLPVAVAVLGAAVVLTRPARPAARRSRGRRLAYATTALAAVGTAAVLLPQSVGERTAGGFVTGNEVTRPAADRPMPTAELASAVEANPDAVGLRLILADRYAAAGEYGPASGHYSEALRRDPGNVQAQLRFGRLLHQLGRPADALRHVDRALATDPGLREARWARASIQLHGLHDPAAALRTLQPLRQRQDLPAAFRDRVEQLAATARQRQETGP